MTKKVEKERSMVRRILMLLGLSLCLMGGNCIQQQVVSYENPSEVYLNMSGFIDEGLEYKVSVIYNKNARKSGCPVFGKDSDICQVKPENFTYIPQIKGTTHSVHIPLKELSPGKNSWWEPHDISICVGPRDPKSVPHQCQVVFSVTKDKHDGNQTLNLVCSQKFWCYEGLHVEHVSRLNREYVVNIAFASDTQGPTTTTLLHDLLNRGRMTEYLDRVLVDLNRWDGPTLLIASQIAMREDRIDDSLLLYHAGTIRFRVDQEHYKPMNKVMGSFLPPIHLLMFPMQYEMSILSARELTDSYATITPQLEEWSPLYDQTYEPGWKYETQPNLQQLSTEFNTIKSNRVQTIRDLITLFSDETYADAHFLVQAYERDLFLDQQNQEKLNAEETMRHIEAQLGIEGYIAALTKERVRRKRTACFDSSADGEKTTCKTNDKHH